MNAQETRSLRRPWRLRTRLAIVLLGMVIALSVLLVVTHLEDLKDRRHSRVETFQTIGDTVATSIDGFTRDLETFTLSTSVTLGQVAPTTQITQENAGPYLSKLVDSYGILRALFITDLSGRVIASNTGDSPGFDLSGRDYVKALQAGKDSVWSSAFAGSQTGETTMTQGRIVRSLDGKPFLFLIAAFYTNQLSSRLPKDLPSDANISLFDENGTVMYNTQDLPEDRLNVSQSPLFQQAKSGETVLLRAQSSPLTNQKLYGAFVPVQRNGWVVGYTRPASAIDGPLVSRFRRDMAIIFALLLLGYAAIVLLTSRLSRPLALLARTADAIARGERPSMPIAAADADVRVLEEAMNSMSLAIADREARLQTQTRVLETLERVGATLATELNFEHAVEAVAHAALDLTRSHAAAFFYYAPDSESAEGSGLMAIHVYAGDTKDIEPASITEDDPFLAATLQGQLQHSEDARFLPGAVRERPVAGEGSLSARSLLGVPVISREGSVRGALILLHSQPNWYNEDYIHLATGLARRGSVIVENARLYSQAQAIQDELRRSNTAKDEFIGVMSHELRTPITTIYGGARLLHARRRHLEETDVEEMIASIEEEAERLYRLVENLLALARIDLGEVLEGEPIAVGPSIEQAVKQFVSRHPSRPVEINMAENLPPARGETSYIHQVIHNLVTNADKYSEAGLPIEVNVTREDDAVAVRVCDNGKGVAPEEMDQIFESFFRSARTAREARGKGLGLTVCKRLVETMSGRIWARNRDEGGLEVGFTLPVAMESQPELEPAETASSTHS